MVRQFQDWPPGHQEPHADGAHQDMTLGQQVAVGAQRGIADLQAGMPQRAVAKMAADSRTTAGDRCQCARQRRDHELGSSPVHPGGWRPAGAEIGGLPTTVTPQPSRVFDFHPRRYVDCRRRRKAASPAMTQAPKAGEVRGGYRSMGGDRPCRRAGRRWPDGRALGGVRPKPWESYGKPGSIADFERAGLRLHGQAHRGQMLTTGATSIEDVTGPNAVTGAVRSAGRGSSTATRPASSR